MAVVRFFKEKEMTYYLSLLFVVFSGLSAFAIFKFFLDKIRNLEERVRDLEEK